MASAKTTTHPALWSDRRTVLNRAARVQVRGAFSHPDGGNTKEDRGSGGGDGNNGPPTTVEVEKNAMMGALFPHNCVQSAGLREVGIPARAGGGGIGGMRQW